MKKKRSWQYYRRLAALYVSYRRRETVVPSPPLRLWLEISSRCNLRCVACPNRELAGERKGDMAWPLFRSLVDQARSFAHEINLHHRGETLLHPEAGRFIAYAVASGVPCRLHTNATLLRGAVADELLAAGLPSLTVSFDGFDAATYEAQRCGASFTEVSDNIAAFLARRRQLGKRNPRLTIEMMAGARQGGGRQGFLARFRGLGLDELHVKRPHNWGGLLATPAAATADGTPPRACTFPWSALVVFFDGRLTACPQDFFGCIDLGDCANTSLASAWNGAPMQELRRAFRDGALDRLPCHECDRIRRPTIAGIPREYLGKMLGRRLR